MIANRESRFLSLTIINIILVIFSLICIIPIIAVISISLSNEVEIIQNGGYSLIPRIIDFSGYKYIFESPKQIINSYIVSSTVTFFGGALSLLVVSLIAYPLSRPDFAYRRKISLYVFITMLFHGGIVANYILVAGYLHLKDTLWVLILPYLAVPWHILILRTFFHKIPMSLIESAKIDGSNEFRTFFNIVLPLSKPGLATVGLFIMLTYWNDWWLSLLYINKNNIIPLQYMLKRMMDNIQFLIDSMQYGITIDISKFPSESARMAMCVVAAGPMLIIFPFFQKYFVKGLTVGAVKG